MGQELSQPLGPHAPNISPISLDATSSLIYDKTTGNMSDDAMADDRYDSVISSNKHSSTTDISAERSDSIGHGANDNAAELDISDDTNAFSETIEQPAFYKRELRPTRGSKRAVPNTWVDADNTGDFDPREEGRQARARRKKAKLSQRKKFDWNALEHTSRLVNDLRHAAKPRPILCISFKTTESKAAFAEMCAKSEQKAGHACDDFLTGYHLRKRGGTDDGRDPTGVEFAGVRVIASETPLDLKNQPAGRGCMDCLAKVQRCSLLDNEHSWPCDECNDSGDDCQLIQVSDPSCLGKVCYLTLSTGTRAQIGMHTLPISW